MVTAPSLVSIPLLGTNTNPPVYPLSTFRYDRKKRARRGLVKSGEIVTRMENRLVKKAAKRREARGHRGGATPAPPTSIL